MLHILVLAFTASIASERFLVKPELFSQLFLVINLFVLDRAISHSRLWLVWTLLPLQCLWANLHGYFILGPIVAGIWWVTLSIGFLKGKKELKKPLQYLLFLIILEILVSFLNPNGINGVLYPLKVVLALSNSGLDIKFATTETLSPLAGEIFSSYTIVLYRLSVLLFLISSLLNLKKIRWVYFLIGAFFLLVSLSMRRNIAQYAIASAPFLALNLTDMVNHIFSYDRLKNIIYKRFFRIIPPIAVSAILIYISCLALTDRPYIEARWHRRTGLSSSELSIPDSPLDFLTSHPLPSEMFNNSEYGSHIIWRTFPKYRVFMHTNYFGVSPDFLKEYQNIIAGRTAIVPVINKYKIRFFVLKYANGEVNQIIRQLTQIPDWKVIYIDSSVIIFLKKAPDTLPILQNLEMDISKLKISDINTPPISRDITGIKPLDRVIEFIGRRKRVLPVGHLNLANLFVLLGRPDLAIQLYQEAIRIDPEYVEAMNGLGATLAETGRLDNALQVFKMALAVKDDHPNTHFNLSMLYAHASRYELALKEIDQAIILEKKREYYKLKGSILESRHSYEEAVDLYKEFASRWPFDPFPHERMIHIFVKNLKAPERARQQLKDLEKNTPGLYYSQGWDKIDIDRLK